MTGMVYKIILQLGTVLLLPHQVFTQCSVGCARCADDGSICNQCETGYWFKETKCVSCPYNCETCTDDFTCQSCKPQFYSDDIQKTCNLPCSTNCTLSGCAYNTGYCNECLLGWYGSKCGEPCNLCRDGLCDLRKCTNECKDSYFQDVISGNYYCRSCVKAECIACLNSTFCTQCNDGYFVRSFITSYRRGEAECQQCLSDYPCGDCDSILNCKACSRVDGRLKCSDCKEGYVLDKSQCINKDQQCPTNCNSCDAHSICNFDCKEGFLGINCGYACTSTNCRTCTKQDSCDSCKDGFYTKFCNETCNTNCLGYTLYTPVCRMNDGYCLNGCKAGFWGEQCQERCNEHCQTDDNSLKVCYKNGTCTHGCYSGYSGPDCSKEVSITTRVLVSTDNAVTISETTSIRQTQTDANDHSDSATQTELKCSCSLGPAIGGSIAGAFVFGVLASAVVFYLRERNLLKRKDRKQSENTYYNMSMEASHQEEPQSGSSKDIGVNSGKCEVTLYEKLSEQKKGNIYDHLVQPSEEEIVQDVKEIRPSAEYYNN